jgi:hypothetical protein
MHPRIPCTAVIAACLLALTCHGPAADPGPLDTHDAAILRKLTEIERLKADLLQAEQELQLLRQGVQPPTLGSSPTATPAPILPPSSLAELPPLTPETVLALDELAAHFRSEPAAAQARYRQRTFVVQGRVSRFNPGFARRYYDLILEPAARAPLVVARCDYLDRYRAVFTRDNGQSLYARVGEREESLLLRTGDAIQFRGRCDGLKNGAIHFSRCTLFKN